MHELRLFSPLIPIYVLLLLLFTSCCSIQPALGLSAEEISGLEEIRNSWPFMKPYWGTPANESCVWPYIVCAQIEGDFHVVELIIDQNRPIRPRPTAMLPTAFKSLSYLRVLRLHNLGLFGPIPDLTSLSKLEILDLEDPLEMPLQQALSSMLPKDSLVELRLVTQMDGGVPTTISLFKKLQRLALSSFDVANPRLSGAIPDNLYDMHTLKMLSLRQTGLMSDISYFGPNIETLDLLDSLAAGPLVDACELLNLVALQGSQTFLSGTIPECLARLPKLKILDLSYSLVSGPIPASFAESALVHFNLSNVPCGGPVPTVLGQMKNLELLDLSSAGLFGTIPSSFSDLVNLTVLQLSNNELSGTVPRLSSTIKNIDLSRNSLFGDLSFIPAHLPTAATVDLSSNTFFGTIPAHLFLIKALNLASNLQIVGPLPFGSLPELSAALDLNDGSHVPLLESLMANPPVLTLPNMVSLNLAKTSLGGFLPQLDAMALQTLNLSNSDLRGMFGTFPEAMTSIDLGTNRMKGFSLPVHLPAFLEELQWSQSFLEGPIPATLLNQSVKLQRIDLSNNQLEGKFPALTKAFAKEGASIQLSFNKNLTGSLESISNGARYITKLEMSSTGLVGTVPQDFFKSFIQLQTLDLSFNALSGPLLVIPPTLSVLILNDNKLTGDFTFAWNFAQFLTELRIANNKFGPEGFIFSAPSLQVLDITNNRYAFNISDGLQQFPHLETVLASSNPIYGGMLPDSVLRSLSSLSLRNTSINGTLNYQKLKIMIMNGLKFLDVSGNPKLPPLAIQPPLQIAPWTINPLPGILPPNVTCYDITSEFTVTFGRLTFPFSFSFDASLFAYKQCKCMEGSYGRPPQCLTCDPSLVCDGQYFLPIPKRSFAFVDYSLLPKEDLFEDDKLDKQNNGSLGRKSNTRQRSGSQRLEPQKLPIFIEPCLGSESQCGGTDITPDLIENLKNISYVSATLSLQCKPGSEGRLCSQCRCTRENPPCYFPRGTGCTECPKSWKIPSRSLFWSVSAVLVALIYLLLSFIMLIILKSRRTHVTIPWEQLSLIKRIFYRSLHFTELGFVPILVTFVQLLSELTHWDSQFLSWLSGASKLLNGDVNGFGLWCLNPDFAQPMGKLVGQQLLPISVSALFIASIGTAAVLYRLVGDKWWKEKNASQSDPMSRYALNPKSLDNKPRKTFDIYESNDEKLFLSENDRDENESDFEDLKDDQIDHDELTSFRSRRGGWNAKTNAYPATALISSMTFSVFQFFYFSSALAAADTFFTSQQVHTKESYLLSLPWLLVSEAVGLRKVSLVFLILVVAGFPLCSLCLILYFRSRIYDPRISVYFGSLVTRYRPGFIWWEFVKIAYKLAIAISLRAVGKSSPYLSGIIALVIVLFATIQVMLRPWKRGLENSVDSISSFLLLMSMMTSGYLPPDQYRLIWPAISLDLVFIIALVAIGAFLSFSEETSYHVRSRAINHSKAIPSINEISMPTTNGAYIPLLSEVSAENIENEFGSDLDSDDTVGAPLGTFIGIIEADADLEGA